MSEQTERLRATLGGLSRDAMTIVPKWGIEQMLQLSERIDAMAPRLDDKPELTITAPASRTDAQIVEQADQLAEHLATVVMGYEFAAIGRFPMREQTDPRLRMCWQMACEAMIVLQATDPNDALSAVED